MGSAWRLLNVDTIAYYVLAIGWILFLVCVSELFGLANQVINAFSPIFLFIILVLVLESLKWVSLAKHEAFLRLTAPGTAVLENWYEAVLHAPWAAAQRHLRLHLLRRVSLMAFVYMIAMPVSLSNVEPTSIVGWILALLLSTILNVAAAGYMAKWMEHPPSCTRTKVQLATQLADAQEVDTLALSEPKAQITAIHSSVNCGCDVVHRRAATTASHEQSTSEDSASATASRGSTEETEAEIRFRRRNAQRRERARSRARTRGTSLQIDEDAPFHPSAGRASRKLKFADARAINRCQTEGVNNSVTDSVTVEVVANVSGSADLSQAESDRPASDSRSSGWGSDGRSRRTSLLADARGRATSIATYYANAIGRARGTSVVSDMIDLGASIATDFGNALRDGAVGPKERESRLFDFAEAGGVPQPLSWLPRECELLLGLLREECERGPEYQSSAFAMMLREKIQSGYGNRAAARRQLRELEPAMVAVEALKRPLPTWDEVTWFWTVTASLASVLFLFTASGGTSYFAIWIFQLSAGIVVHTLCTAHRARLLGWVPPKVQIALQPALLSTSLLIAVAGFSWPDGFMDGLSTYIMRATANGTFYEVGFSGWGPGKPIAAMLTPAIIVLAFPTSQHLPKVKGRMHFLVPLNLFCCLLSLVTAMLFARLLIEWPSNYSDSSTSVAIATVPHSVSTPVAIGYSTTLCRGDVCAHSSVMTNSCVVTATFVMIVARPFLTAIGVTSPFARGVSCGSTGMALGVSCLKAGGEDEAVGNAAMSYALFAVWASLIFTIHLSVTSLDFLL